MLFRMHVEKYCLLQTSTWKSDMTYSTAREPSERMQAASNGCMHRAAVTLKDALLISDQVGSMPTFRRFLFCFFSLARAAFS